MRYARRVRIELLAVTALSACPGAETIAPPLPPVSAGKVHVRVFTEPAPARALEVTSGFALVATDNGVERWDPSNHVVASDALVARALALDVDTAFAWVLTDNNLGRDDIDHDTYTELPPPPIGMEPDPTTASLAPGDGGVGIGSSHGLVFASDATGWTPTPIVDGVRALVRDGAGWLWIATKQGLVARKPTGELVTPAIAIADVRVLVTAPGDRVLAIGTDDANHERIAIGAETTWSTYRTLPGVPWVAATRRGGGVFMMAGDRLYRRALADGTTRPLARDGMRLVPMGSDTAGVEWAIDPIDIVLPPDPIALGAADDQLLVGTRDLGTARYRDGDRHPHDWLRRRAMFADATTLSVACSSRDDCWLATGAHRAWHWTKDRFVATGPDDDVLAVARDPAGAIYALHRNAAEPTAIKISRLEGATWIAQPRLALATQGDRAEVAFARFGSSNRLWVGLGYREDDEPQSFGVAIVDIAAGKVAYHEANGKLPVPIGSVAAAVRGAPAWFATDDGVVRLAGRRRRAGPSATACAPISCARCRWRRPATSSSRRASARACSTVAAGSSRRRCASRSTAWSRRVAARGWRPSAASPRGTDTTCGGSTRSAAWPRTK